MPPSPVAFAVMVDEAAAPLAAHRRIVAARDQARILDRDHRLVIVAIERPGLDLALAALAAVQQRVERVQPVIAPRPDVAQLRLQLLRRSCSFTARSPFRPRRPPSPRASTWRAFRRTLDQDRIGVVDVDVDAPAAQARQAPRASRPRRRSACGPCAGRSCPGAGRDHLVVDEKRAVEQHDVGAGKPLRMPASRRRRRERRAAGASPHAISTPTLAAGLARESAGSSSSR